MVHFSEDAIAPPLGETIVARATPPGIGGVAVVRVSGADVAVRYVAAVLFGDAVLQRMQPRYAVYCRLLDAHGHTLDRGVALYFPAPHSFTGESVLEFQGHGGPVVVDRILARILCLGVRLAQPGEFSQRAFLNNKMDLAQAEAVADLIHAQSEKAAAMAVRVLEGALSTSIDEQVSALTQLRAFVEAALDFADEDIDFLTHDQVGTRIHAIHASIVNLITQAKQGCIMQEGVKVAIMGPPNAGKSSLMNVLSQGDTAIVTPVPGTTRDVIMATVVLNHLPLHLMDTAGIRETDDHVEKIGIARAWSVARQADCILFVVDVATQTDAQIQHALSQFGHQLCHGTGTTVGVSDTAVQETRAVSLPPVVLVKNKIDLLESTTVTHRIERMEGVAFSAKKQIGLDALYTALNQALGVMDAAEGQFIARRRHLDALYAAVHHLKQASDLMQGAQPELIAQTLLLAQESLSRITGQLTPDALLGEIFSQFCIGK